MIAFAALLLAGIDAWTVPAGAGDAARAHLPDWINKAADHRVVIAEADRTVIHLGEPIPVYFIDELKSSAFLSDLNPTAHAQRTFMTYPVLGSENNVLGDISLECISDTCGVGRAMMYWEARTAVNEAMRVGKSPGVARVLGVVNWSECWDEWRVACVDNTGNASLVPFSTMAYSVRFHDIVVVGVLSNRRERAISIAEEADATHHAEIKYFDTAEIDVERVLKGRGWPLTRLRICFPSQGEAGLPPNCPPNVQNGDRRIWLLNSEASWMVGRPLLEGSGAVIAMDNLEQVEREIEASPAVTVPPQTR